MHQRKTKQFIAELLAQPINSSDALSSCVKNTHFSNVWKSSFISEHEWGLLLHAEQRPGTQGDETIQSTQYFHLSGMFSYNFPWVLSLFYLCCLFHRRALKAGPLTSSSDSLSTCPACSETSTNWQTTHFISDTYRSSPTAHLPRNFNAHWIQWPWM